MLLALSTVSSQGLWLLASPQATQVLAYVAWDDSDSTGLSEKMSHAFDELLQKNGQKLEALTGLYVVSGPGSFTGLRMGSAFMQGLARARGLPLRAIPTFDLVGKPFCIPTRHQAARHLTLHEALAQNVDFLQLRSATETILQKPDPTDLIWGLQDRPFWPQPAELLAGIHRNQLRAPGLQLDYGLNPKIAGQRG